MDRVRLVAPWAAAAAAAALAVAVGLALGGDSTPADGFTAGVLLAGAIAGACLIAAFAPAVTISAGIVLSIFSGHFDQFGSPVGLDRVVVICGVLTALVRDLRAPHPRLRTKGIHFLLAALAVYALMSALFSGRLLENNAAFALLDNFGLIPFVLFWIAPAAFPGPHERNILLAALVGTGVYLGVTAVLETTGPTWLVVPSYIMDPDVGIHFGRARGPFTEAAENGLSMFFCATAAAIAFVRWRRARWVAAACIALCGFGIVFTLTRQVWLASALATLVALVSARQLRSLVLPAIAVGAVVVIGTFTFVPGFNHRAQGRLEDQRPVWDRLNSNAAAWRMAETRPLAGLGWYAYGTAAREYYRLGKDRPLTTVGRPHNVFLANAAELGIVVSLAWIGAIAWAFVGGVRRRGPPDLDAWRIGLVAVAVAWAVVANFTPMGYAMDHWLFWLWLGIGWSRV